MATIASTINTHVYNEIRDNFLIPILENWFGDDEVIFQYNNAFFCRFHTVMYPTHEQ